MKQPALGVTASAIIIAVSLAVIRLLGTDLFMGWASYALMGAIPFSIVVGAFWQGKHPVSIARLGQPWRGLAYLALAAVAAAVVSWVHWLLRAGGATPPPPMAVMTIITSVVTTFLLVIVFGGWPFTLIRSKVTGGLALLVSAYVINALIFRLMNFGFAQGAPFYDAALDPSGPFGAWDVVVVMVTMLSVMFALLHLDLRPFGKLPGRLGQPLFGLVWLACCLAVALVLFWIGTTLLRVPAPTFMVAVPVPFIFGTILLLNMLGNSLSARLAQPTRGLIGIVAAFVLGFVLAQGYAALMPVLSAPLPSGPSGDFAAEVWLANGLLAVTFPLLAFASDFFGLWPLAPRDSEASA